MKKHIAILMAAVLCLGALVGCTSPAGDAEKLIVGLDDTFAPMGFRDSDNNLVGFDIDLATAVGKELGMEIVFQPIDWNSKEMELNANTVDCLWNGMSRTPAREKSMTLSQNYLNNKLIVMKNNGIVLNSKEDLANINYGTQAGSSSLEILMEDDVFDVIKDTLSEYKDYDECIMDMQAGRIDAMIVDAVLGKYKNENLDTKLEVAPFDFGDDLYVIGFRKEDTDLCAKVEQAIKAVIDSGEGKKISEKWFGEDLLLPIE